MADAVAKVWMAGKYLISGGAVALGLALGGCAGGLPDAMTTASTTKADDTVAPAELAKAGPLAEKTLGNPNAPVTVIEYASLGCPICAAYHKSVFPQFKKAFVDTGKVHFIYREFPIGASPAAAAHAARCVPENAYWHVNDKFMANRGRWNGRTPNPEFLYKIVQETGISRAAFDSCMSN